jgi:hypothetical protein
VPVGFDGCWFCLAVVTRGGFLAEMEGDGDDCERGAPFVCTLDGGGRLILGGSGGGTAVTTTGAIAAAQQPLRGVKEYPANGR